MSRLRDTGLGGAIGRVGPEGVALEGGPPLARAAAPALGKSVDGIVCGSGEARCFSYLHTHATDRIIHLETAPAVPAGL